jgi:hypothetical protein
MDHIRTYSEMVQFETFQERFQYLRLGAGVGDETFGSRRPENQAFYHSREWQDARIHVISRDRGCDLGVFGFEIHDEVVIHHINPMTPEDVYRREAWIVDPEFLVTTRHPTHNAIHFGLASMLPPVAVERTPGDTRLW